MANLHVNVRPAGRADIPLIATLLQEAVYQHVHVDWLLPVDWLGTAGFVVAESTAGHPRGAGKALACLAIGADPPPAAWVRVAAVHEGKEAAQLLRAMLATVLPSLRAEGLTEVGWMPRLDWPAASMTQLDFELVNHVETLVKPNLTIPSTVRPNEEVVVRPVRQADLPHLAAIEEQAFEPLWRHSVEGLARGRRYAISFDVAELDGRIVAFQYSADGERRDTAHLVRLTVSPDAQRSGVGSALMRAALEGYRQRGLGSVSLNTQADNVPSKRLYQAFAFKPAGYRWPVWCLSL